MQEFHLDHLVIVTLQHSYMMKLKHIKKNHDALGTLLETNRLKIREPSKESTQDAIKCMQKILEIFHSIKTRYFHHCVMY